MKTANQKLADAALEDRLTNAERELLRYIYAKNGRRTKTLIREAWQTGIYDARLVTKENDEQLLQQMRNVLGPSWLEATNFSSL